LEQDADIEVLGVVTKFVIQEVNTISKINKQW